MQHTTDRRTVLSVISAGGLAALAGCTGGDDGDDTFRLSVPFFPETLDPLDSAWRTRELGILESPFRVDENGEIEAQLVTDWEVSDDSLTWTFEFREDITFHDGSHLEAEAVAFSLNRLFTDQQSRLQGLPVESVEEIDNVTVSITTSEPLAPLPAHLSRPYAGILSPDSAADDGTIEELIATGPYAFESWEPDTQLTVTSHDEYYGEPSAIDTMIYERVQDGQTRTLKLQNGELDLATNLPNSAAAELRDDDETELYLNEGVSDRIAVFNTERAPLDDPRVRKALLYAIDKEAIAEFVLDGVGTPAYRPWDPSTVDWANEDVEPYTHEPERAESLLAEAGWERDGDDEVRQRDGQPLNVEIWAYTERPNLPDIAEAMQAQLGEVGFDIDVRVTEWGALDEAKGELNYDMFIGLWGFYGSPPDPDTFAKYYHPEEEILDSPYDNPEVTELLEAGRTTFDEERRREIYDEIQEIVMEDVPVGFLTRQTHVNGARSGVEGYDPHPHIFELGLDKLTR